MTFTLYDLTLLLWHLQFGMNSKSHSLVTFSTAAQTRVSLGQDVLAGVDALDYKGGLTNHGEAIKACQSTFDGSGADTKDFILLVTDGVATTKVSKSIIV